MTLHFLSNSELLRLAENSDNPLIIELAVRPLALAGGYKAIGASRYIH